MTPEQLKSSILQYAIQGKLVEQRAEEGTGEELYKEIQAEKQRLIKEGKIKKEKILPEISEDEIPFDIPDSWKWVRLGECGYFVRGSGIKKDEVRAYGFPCVRYGQLYTHYRTKFKSTISFVEEEVYSKCKKAKKSDILMSLTGENNFDIALAVTYEGDKEIAIGGDMTKFSGCKIDPLYLTYVINSPYGISCKSKVATGNIIVHISNDKLASILISLPPLAEQKRIVSKIEELLSYVEKYASNYEKLEKLNARFPDDMKKSILHYAIQGKLVEQRAEEGTGEELYKKIQAEKQRLIKEGKLKKEKILPEISEDEVPFDVPESWKWVRLGEIVSVLGGKRIPAGRKLTSKYTGHKYIRVSDMKNGTVLTDNILFVPDDIYPYISKYIINKEDAYITVAGTIGKVGIIPDELDGANLTENADRLVFNNRLDKKWLVSFLQSKFVQSQIDSVTTKVGQPKLAIRRIQEIFIPLPPLAEQKRIVSKIEELLPYIDRLTRK